MYSKPCISHYFVHAPKLHNPVLLRHSIHFTQSYSTLLRAPANIARTCSNTVHSTLKNPTMYTPNTSLPAPELLLCPSRAQVLNSEHRHYPLHTPTNTAQPLSVIGRYVSSHAFHYPLDALQSCCCTPAQPLCSSLRSDYSTNPRPSHQRCTRALSCRSATECRSLRTPQPNSTLTLPRDAYLAS